MVGQLVSAAVEADMVLKLVLNMTFQWPALGIHDFFFGGFRQMHMQSEFSQRDTTPSVFRKNEENLLRTRLRPWIYRTAAICNRFCFGGFRHVHMQLSELSQRDTTPSVFWKNEENLLRNETPALDIQDNSHMKQILLWCFQTSAHAGCLSFTNVTLPQAFLKEWRKPSLGYTGQQPIWNRFLLWRFQTSAHAAVWVLPM